MKSLRTNKALPTIHMNGTSKRMLLDGWRKVALALCDLEGAIETVEFNGRDYYPRGDEAFSIARAEFEQALKGLNAFRDFAKMMHHGISAGGFDAEEVAEEVQDEI